MQTKFASGSAGAGRNAYRLLSATFVWRLSPVLDEAGACGGARQRTRSALRLSRDSVVSVLTPADPENHIDKRQFTVPFVCGARNLGEALRRIAEGAAMIRTKGEAGTGGRGRAGPITKSVQHPLPHDLYTRGKSTFARKALSSVLTPNAPAWPEQTRDCT